MTLPRWLHRLYAWAGGYFWLPCPHCGRHFGGHEIYLPEIEISAFDDNPIPCPTCAQRREAEAKRQLRRTP